MDRCESGVRREIVDPEGELIPGETIVKLYYCKRLDGYVTVPGASLFKVAAVAPGVHPGEDGVNSTVALQHE